MRHGARCDAPANWQSRQAAAGRAGEGSGAAGRGGGGLTPAPRVLPCTAGKTHTWEGQSKLAADLTVVAPSMDADDILDGEGLPAALLSVRLHQQLSLGPFSATRWGHNVNGPMLGYRCETSSSPPTCAGNGWDNDRDDKNDKDD